MRWCAAHHEAFGPQPLCRLGLASFSRHFFRRLRRGVNRMSLQVRGDVARSGFESRNVRRRGAGVRAEDDLFLTERLNTEHVRWSRVRVVPRAVADP